MTDTQSVGKGQHLEYDLKHSPITGGFDHSPSLIYVYRICLLQMSRWSNQKLLAVSECLNIPLCQSIKCLDWFN